jgi:hypothetical protein
MRCQTAQVSVRVFNIQQKKSRSYNTGNSSSTNLPFLFFFFYLKKKQKKTKDIRPIKSQKAGRTV